MDLNDLKTDPTLEQEGVWVSFRDARLLIARSNNPRMVAGYAARIRPFRGGRIPTEEHERIMRECLGEFVLLGWDGITSGGAPFLYSAQNARDLLRTDELLRFVMETAQDFDLFRRTELAEAVGAVAKNSGGGSSGAATPAG